MLFFVKKKVNVSILKFLWMSVILPNGIGNHSSQVIHEILLLHRSNSSRKKRQLQVFFFGLETIHRLRFNCVRSYERITCKTGTETGTILSSSNKKFIIFTLSADNFCRHPVIHRLYSKDSVLAVYKRVDSTVHTLFYRVQVQKPHSVYQVLTVPIKFNR
jgi:hypothetical protein